MLANGSNGSNSDSEDNKQPWKKGMNTAEQMHVLASAGISPDDDDIKFDKDELKAYKKKAKNYCRNKRG